MREKLTARLEASAGSRAGSLARLPLASKVALGFLTLLALAALCAPLIAGDPLASGTPVTEPGAGGFFGTDAVGRDVFSRVLWGARTSLVLGLCATGAALLVAAVLGSVAATANKAVGEVLMRLLDIVMSFPGIALAAVFVAVFGNSLPVLVLAIGFLYVPQLSRVVRANVVAQLGEDYVSASRVMGASTAHILVVQVARNCLAPILVFATILVADAIVFEASLSFINAGVKPPAPSWGNILADGKQVLLSGFWWPTFFPGLFILLTVLSLNILAEGLTDALASPSIRKRVDVAAEERALVEGADAKAGADTKAGADAKAGSAMLGTVDAAEARRLLDGELARLTVSERARTDRLRSASTQPPLLSVRNLSISFPQAHGDVRIVDDVSFDVRPSETMGLVGESGCGKSISAMAIMGLLPPTARLEGEVLFEGRNLLDLDPKERNALRGHHIAMIYQDALSALNPSMLIRSQLKQLIRRGGTRSAEELLELVGLDPARTLKSYPHELSGGQRQRVLIAMALTRDPKLLIADEPTTALDVTVQQQVVDLLNDLREKLGFAMIFVSHDLALVAQLAHRVTVMYAGQVVEQGAVTEVLASPTHEYTRGLLGAVLSIEAGAARLHQVPGTVPSPKEFEAGDRFAPRSAHPGVGVDERPHLVAVPGLDGAPADHVYATTRALQEALRSTVGSPR